MSFGPRPRPHRVAREHVVLVVAALVGQARGELDRHRRVVRPLAPLPGSRGDHVAQWPAVASPDLVGVQPLDGRAERVADREPEHARRGRDRARPRDRAAGSRRLAPRAVVGAAGVVALGRALGSASGSAGTAGRCGGRRWPGAGRSTPRRSWRRAVAASSSRRRSERADAGANGLWRRSQSVSDCTMLPIPASTRWSSRSSPTGRSTARARRRYSAASKRPWSRSGPSASCGGRAATPTRPAITRSPAAVRST